MELSISREALLAPLQRVVGTIDRKQSSPILSNVLIQVEPDCLTLTGTDCEVELIARVNIEQNVRPGKVTVPAKKVIDICKNLPDGSNINLSLEKNKVILTSGRSRFSLSTLDAEDFPLIEDCPGVLEFSVQGCELSQLIDSTYFSMAQQDVRYFLNGLLLEVSNGCVCMVATDGHRLAMASLQRNDLNASHKVILPRKGVMDLKRILQDNEAKFTVTLTANHLHLSGEFYRFSCKLVDGNFPAYDRVIPKNNEKQFVIERDILKSALARVSILSNEKYRGVRLHLRQNNLLLDANNPEQEEAEESLPIEYTGDELDICFNVTYLLDILTHVPAGEVKFSLSNTGTGALIESFEVKSSIFVVMPMQV